MRAQRSEKRALPHGERNHHAPVLLSESLLGLGLTDSEPAKNTIIVDGTFGRGGHSGAILKALNGSGALHALDQDPDAALTAKEKFSEFANFHFHAINFSQLQKIAADKKLVGKINGILLDLGVSSPQLDNAERGFSFSHDGPLDMRMNPNAGESAAEWLAVAKEVDIANVLYTYGDERNSRRIAQRIVETRIETPLTRTAQLAALIAAVPGPRSKTIHPATRSFQAIRIHINRELDVLKEVLAASLAVLAPNGRLAVISFHSLEDRIVKQFIRDHSSELPEEKNKYAHLKASAQPISPAADQPVGLRLVSRIFPSDAECAINPRARSAVLRVAEKIGGAL